MIHFVGAGPGAPDLITVRGQKLLEEADVIIYAGSLVNPELLQAAGEGCRIYNSAYMTLEEVLRVMEDAEKEGVTTVRLHTGDPSIYGAVREQMEELEKRNIAYDVTPGVSSFCGAAAALGMEYTLPGISQSVILTRMEGRTKVPEKDLSEQRDDRRTGGKTCGRRIRAADSRSDRLQGDLAQREGFCLHDRYAGEDSGGQ